MFLILFPLLIIRIDYTIPRDHDGIRDIFKSHPCSDNDNDNDDDDDDDDDENEDEDDDATREFRYIDVEFEESIRQDIFPEVTSVASQDMHGTSTVRIKEY
uniref:Uncharacterized protein n=1 Tax=Vespula pensylvanica TaxID=30213 RepID=A0A834PFB7_VESPE|nr:hypothetical protein H0235_001217 [Vespula pensylvanica]